MNNKLSVLEIILCYGAIIKDFFTQRRRKHIVRKEVINGKVVTIIDVKYKEVA